MKKLLIHLSCLCLFVVNISAQSMKSIVGSVLDENNEPIIGATIMAKGTDLGTITDFDGNFQLRVPESTTHILVSYVGMKQQELQVAPTMRITLFSDTQLLQEVVVTGIGRMDKRLFTGASDKIDASAAKLDGISDVSRALEGRSAGVSVQNVSGTFGTAPKIRVRGATSIYGDSKPLWVVDGVVVENIINIGSDDLSSGNAETLISSAIAGLNAEDIESFDILKDGSATSIYGARAMAGVIVITTKKGRPGVSSISYTGEFTYRMVPSYNEFNIMNSQDQMGVYQEMQSKGWLDMPKLVNASNSGLYGKMFQLMRSYDEKTGTFGLANTPEAMNNYLRQAEMRNTDWFDLLFNNSIMQNHSVSVSSGSEKSSYYASISAMYDPGWTLQSNTERYTGNFNANYNILKNLSLNMISMASYRKQRAPGTVSQSADVVSGEVKRDFDINPYSYALNSSRVLDPNEFYTSNYAPFNIFNELENNYMDLEVVDLKFQGEMKWKVLRGLEVAALGALNYKSSAQEHHVKDNSNLASAYRAMDNAVIRENNKLLYKDPDKPYVYPSTVLPSGGAYNRTDYRMRSLDFRTTLSWVEEFNQLHLVNFFGGMELNSTERGGSSYTGWGMQYSLGEVPFFEYEMFKKLKEDGSNYYNVNSAISRMVAFFGSATYSYKGIYSLNATGRYEGTNQMGRSRKARWLPTWNLGLAWNVHEEEFFGNFPDEISHLMLKTSYSLTGSPIGVSNSSVIIASISQYRPFSNLQESALGVSMLENSELTYEKKHEFNIGAEMGLLGNRVNFGIDWFNRNNFDLIGITYTQGIGGELFKYANVANMKSHGIELTLTTRNITRKGFDWITNFIFGKSETRVTRFESLERAMGLVAGNGFTMEGYPVRGLFSFRFQGLDENGFPTFLREDGTVSSFLDGEINFQNRQDLEAYLKYEGPTDPPVTGGLENMFRYKGFTLNLRLTYSFGNVIRLNPVFAAGYSDLTAMTKEFKNRWVLPGDEKATDIPTILSYRQYLTASSGAVQSYNAYNFSDARVAKGDFIRMKEISLTYDFSREKLPEQMSALSLKLQGTNLFLLYADKKLNGQDPEFFQSGGVSTPIPKQFTLTLRAGF